MDSYAFDAAWAKERDRLRALEAVFDQATTRRQADVGVGPGWRCLEAGCSAGGVALWLAGRVGATGRVLATDLDTRFVAGHGQPNLDVQRHDITAQAAFTAIGADASIGPHLAGWLAEAGLEHVGAEIHGPIAAGGSEYWARGSIEQLADHLIATGLITAADVQRYLTLAADPAFLYPPPILVSAWGQQPAGLPDRRHGHDSMQVLVAG
jgi:hypothetical protein